MLQDHFVDKGITNVSYIRTYGNEIDFICEQSGKIFLCSSNGIENLKNKLL